MDTPELRTSTIYGTGLDSPNFVDLHANKTFEGNSGVNDILLFMC